MFADFYLYLGVALAGLASFFSPCVLPLVPSYPIWLAGKGCGLTPGRDRFAVRHRRAELV